MPTRGRRRLRGALILLYGRTYSSAHLREVDNWMIIFVPSKWFRGVKYLSVSTKIGDIMYIIRRRIYEEQAGKQFNNQLQDTIELIGSYQL